MPVGPLVQHRAVEPLHLGVGLGPIGAGEALDRAEVGNGLAEVVIGAVVAGGVGHDPLDGDAVGVEPATSAAQEPGAGLAPRIGQDLDIGQPGVMIDGGMHMVVARSGLPAPVAGAVLDRVATWMR